MFSSENAYSTHVDEVDDSSKEAELLSLRPSKGLKPRKVLIISSSTGGGHDMRAKAFKSWTETEAGRHFGLDVTIHQALETTSQLYRFGVWLYNWIQRVLPTLHHLYFNFLEFFNPVRRADRILGGKGFQEIIREIRPDVIISTHAHLNYGFFDLAREITGKDCCRYVTYCGELFDTYGFSRHWVNPKVDCFIGAVKETCRGGNRLGVPEERSWSGGFLLNPQFYQTPMSQDEKESFIRDRLRLDPDQFILVLATGANGANNHIRFLNELLAAGLKPQVVAMCGRDHDTFKDVLIWAAEHRDWTVRALGYYNQIFQLLQCASCVVARPGTGTTSEAVMAGCPIIFNTVGGIMPQEMITVEFFRRNFSWPKPVGRTKSLPNRVKRWIQQPQELLRARRIMESVQPDSHPIEILRRIRELADETEPYEPIRASGEG
ncbi:MAG: UDP-N-acetylglucosamine--LPS N-acetylglucosamine transferase [Opitutales bacterium]